MRSDTIEPCEAYVKNTLAEVHQRVCEAIGTGGGTAVAGLEALDAEFSKQGSGMREAGVGPALVYAGMLQFLFNVLEPLRDHPKLIERFAQRIEDDVAEMKRYLACFDDKAFDSEDKAMLEQLGAICLESAGNLRLVRKSDTS